MIQPKALFKQAWPYQDDIMNLPVGNLDNAIQYYESIFGLKLVSRVYSPVPSAVLSRDAIKIGLAENGGDSSQDGSFIEVDNLQAAYDELKRNGLNKDISSFENQKYGETEWMVFFVVAPDGLCYCLGERVEKSVI